VIRGERHANAKLSACDAKAIRAALTSGELYRCIAARYGVSQATIAHIKYGRRWA
jgi:hypothetical protein